MECFHKKSRFFSGTNKFWVVQNSFPILSNLNKINVRKKATRISTFDFATLYTTISHDLLIDVLKDIICFVFVISKVSLKILSFGPLRERTIEFLIRIH